MTYDKTSVAGKAIQAIHKKQKPKGELYDMQGIEGLHRVSDSDRSFSGFTTKKSTGQTAEEWLELCRIGGNDNRDSDGEYVIITDARDALAMARTQEREKFNDAGQIRTLIKVRDAMRDERIKQETAKKILEELELRFGPIFEKEKKQYKVEP